MVEESAVDEPVVDDPQRTVLRKAAGDQPPVDPNRTVIRGRPVEGVDKTAVRSVVPQTPGAGAEDPGGRPSGGPPGPIAGGLPGGAPGSPAGDPPGPPAGFPGPPARRAARDPAAARAPADEIPHGEAFCYRSWSNFRRALGAPSLSCRAAPADRARGRDRGCDRQGRVLSGHDYVGVLAALSASRLISLSIAAPIAASEGDRTRCLVAVCAARFRPASRCASPFAASPSSAAGTTLSR